MLAVSIFAIALGLYAAATQPLLPGFSEATTADETIDRVWDDIADDGIFHASDGFDPLVYRIEGDTLPAGSSVYVTVTAVDGGEYRQVDAAGFPSGYTNETDPSDVLEFNQYLAAEGTPEDASVATRSIPVALENEADVRSGTLRVEVW